MQIMAKPLRAQFMPLGGNVNGMRVPPGHWLLMYPQSTWATMTDTEYQAASGPKRVRRKRVSHKPTPDAYIAPERR
jgi:hypothetical protein